MIALRAVREREPAEPVDRRRHDGERRLDRRHHPAARHALPDLELREQLRLRLEPVGELVRPAHRLAEQDPGDRQRLLDEARDVGERLLRRGRDLAPLGADAACQQDEDRDQREREQRELPAERDHADHRRDHRRHVRDDRRGGARDDVLDAADVVRDARLHLAGARAREEREREPLQVAEDGRAQVVHDALADLVREQRLPDAEHAGDDRDHDHRGRVDRELPACRSPGSPAARRAAGTPARRRASRRRRSVRGRRRDGAGSRGRGRRPAAGWRA